jgi:DNA-binding NarL/FixJ family response regulator
LGRRILIADDHPLFRDALKIAVLRASPDASVIEVSSVAEAMAAAGRHAGLALILLDLWMPDSEGFYGLARMRANFPAIPILVVTAAGQPEAQARALDYGAAGFLVKSAGLPEIETAITAVLAGGKWPPAREPGADAPADPIGDMARRIASLTPAQLKVLQGVLQGRLNKQIAHEMEISEATVKAHMTSVFRKLGVANRTQAVLAARALELADPTSRI